MNARVSAILIVVTIGLIGVSFVFAWQNPSATPPNGNLPAPVNVSAAGQTKIGALNILSNVGIGTTSPAQRLDVAGNIRAYNGELISQLGAAPGNARFIGGNYGALIRNDGVNTNLFLTASGDQYGSWNSLRPLQVNNVTGDVYFANATTYITHANGNLTVGGGSGKINVGTIDPIYTISGEKFATYVSGMTGVKEETTGVVELRRKNENATRAEAVIDFKNAAKGSDAWLFWQTTDFGERWEKLVILLTSDSNGKVWYKKDPAKKLLTIYGENGGEVSYRLTAPRFDHAEWPNTSDDSSEGFKIEAKD